MSQLDSMTPKQFFKALESASPTDSLPPLATLLDAVQFNEDGLIPAIAQQHDTKEVLMMAWMNREALEETLTTQRVCYYSRSRQKLWRKGETSGNELAVVEMRVDCDQDALLLRVKPAGPACHTGRRSCFYRRIERDGSLTFLDTDA